jgi:(1->4)-alpha-D-glucan 1-alpha-D-glucosylmutase
MMQIPSSTYRIQFCPQFGFGNALAIVEYLSDLGISHLYASPIFRAKAGSTHGYDVVDPNALNSELGTIQDFDALRSALRTHGIGWIQDIVPNHMAFDSKNEMLMDVLENGAASPFYRHFDIEWNHPVESLRNKVLAPHLGRIYGQCLEDGEIQLSYDQDGLHVRFYDQLFPVRMESYPKVIGYNLNQLEAVLGTGNPDLRAFLEIIATIERTLPSAGQKERSDLVLFCKKTLWKLYTTNAAIASHLDANLQLFNGQKGNPDSFTLLDELLSDQIFRLSFWKVATEEINYRRFFNINQLISVRVEDEQVFRDTHDLVLKSVWHGDFDGLRVDHVDGLYDPEGYLRRLRDGVPDAYLVVEKILEGRETLPSSWPIQGTSGYDFLTAVNSLFCLEQSEREMTELYETFVGRSYDFPQFVAEKKRLIIGKHMAGDIDRLAHVLKSIAARDRYARDITLYALRRALVEILALFPVYRTYISKLAVGPQDGQVIRDAVQRARESSPALVYELDFIERFLLLDFLPGTTSDEQQQWLQFVMKFQQLTGPLMAKGFEDTVLYEYNRLLSLNEVGGNPESWGLPVDDFHTLVSGRSAAWPHTMNTTATHDTKRGEDVRARINVLSEMPAQWARKVRSWRARNRENKAVGSGGEIPDANDEYLLYQTLIGAFPVNDAAFPAFVDRIKEYMIKAVREAKTHTAWIKPDESYEAGVLAFVDAILAQTEQNEFLRDLMAFQKTINHYGIFNALSQTVLKMTVPGVPDFYQGNELWDLNLVDPDNRRPVDFELRQRYLQDILFRQGEDPEALRGELLASKDDGRIKLYTIFRILTARRKFAALFDDGEYIPLEVRGKHKAHVIAFARRYEHQWAVTAVPRHLVALMSATTLPLGRNIWHDTTIRLPGQSPQRWVNLLTDKSHDARGGLEAGVIFSEFPVAVLIGSSNPD